MLFIFLTIVLVFWLLTIYGTVVINKFQVDVLNCIFMYHFFKKNVKQGKCSTLCVLRREASYAVLIVEHCRTFSKNKVH